MFSYLVNVIDRQGQQQEAHLKSATPEDFKGDWVCDWQNLWSIMDPDCEAVIKLSHKAQSIGFMKFGLYPYPQIGNKSEYLLISNIEAQQGQRRIVKPVGLWLIWYATQISLEQCTGDPAGSIVILDAYERAIPYYSNKIGMEGLGWTTISPTEEGYAFRFTQAQARQFCSRLERKWSSPRRID